jgi:DNA-binding CsgD family transcriptional regulator
LAEQVLAGSPEASDRGRALQILGELRYHEDSYVEAIPLFEEALTVLEGERRAVELHVNLGIARWHLGDIPAQAAHAQAAVELAERVGDQGLLASALANSVLAEFYLNRPLDRARLEHALTLEDPDRRLLMPMRPSLIAGVLEFFSDNLDRAASLLSGLRQRTIDRGQDSDLPNLDSNLSAVEWRRGDLRRALEFANEGCEIARMLGSDIGQADNLGQRCFVRAALGDVDGARDDAAEGSAIARRSDVGQAAVWLACALAFLELSLGDSRAAHRSFEPIGALLEPAGDCDAYLATVLPDRIEALIAVGELERAQALTASLERHGRAHDRASVRAQAARCRALAAAARGDPAAAEREIEQALVEHARFPMPLELARTLLIKGQIERRSKHKRAARESFERALGTFEDLGARLWAQRARVELERTGTRHSEGDTLTPTELQVAELAADGLTNKRISEAMFISAKTVEANLARIYLKLGIRSRAELGRAMADHPRSDDPRREASERR